MQSDVPDEPVEPVDEAAGAPDGGDKMVMDLLQEHVPLSLLVDLSDPEGPHSREILESEGQPEDSWWLQDGVDSPDEEPKA